MLLLHAQQNGLPERITSLTEKKGLLLCHNSNSRWQQWAVFIHHTLQYANNKNSKAGEWYIRTHVWWII